MNIDMKLQRELFQYSAGFPFARLEVHNARAMGEAGLYLQLMEEAGELIQACGKKLREMGHGQPLAKGTDPSGIEHNLMEEMADTTLVIDEILSLKALQEYDHDPYEEYVNLRRTIEDIQMKKLERTANRYEEALNDSKHEKP